MENLERKLYEMGISKKHQGVLCLRYALEVIKQDETARFHLKEVHVEVAKRLHTKPERVARNIRTLSEIMWKEENRPILTELAGYPLRARPTEKELIGIFFDWIEKTKNETSFT